MRVGAGLYMYVVVVQKFTFAISSPDEFLSYFAFTFSGEKQRFHLVILNWISSTILTMKLTEISANHANHLG